jgi:hypothetical protein
MLESTAPPSGFGDGRAGRVVVHRSAGPTDRVPRSQRCRRRP